MAEHNRRASDNEDHDELVSMKTHMKYLCKTVDEIKKLQLAQTQMCACRVKDCQNFFVSSRVFNTILTIAILIVGSVSLIAYQTKQDLAVHKTQLSHKHEDQQDKLTPKDYIIPEAQAFDGTEE